MIGVFLARILAPEAFGLIAMLSVFVLFAQALVDGGFASALIQRKELTERHKSSIFHLNVLVSTLLTATFLILAPWIASFYHQPLVTPMLRVLVSLLVFNALCMVQNALLIRQLELRRQTIIVLSSMGVSGAIAVILAWRGFGAWSLVWQQVIQSFARCAMLWWSSKWRPSWLFDLKALKEMFAFAWAMLASALMNGVFDNLYPLIIGKYFSAVELGYFNRAQALQSNASQGLAGIANRVVFPVFSGLQDDLIRFRSGLRKAMTTIAFVQFPIMVGLAVVAKPLILLVFTDKWLFSIPYLQLLAIAGMFYPVHMLNLNVLLSLGRSDLFFRLGALKLLFFAVNAMATVRWGVAAMIWGLIFFNVPAYFLNSYYTKKLIGYSVSDQLRDLFPYLIASALMGLFVAAIGSLLPVGNLLQLGVQIGLGAVMYVLVCVGFRLPALGELTSILFFRAAVATRSH